MACSVAVPGMAVLLAAFTVVHVEVWIVLLAVVALICAAGALHLLGTTRPQGLAVSKKITLAIVGAVALPLFGFWQQFAYLPSQNQASLTVTPTVTLAPDPAGGRHLVVTTNLANQSQVRAS